MKRLFSPLLSSRVARAVPLVLALVTTGCDQVTKRLARGFFEGHGPTELFSGVLTLVPAENPGAFLGMGGSLAPPLRNAIFVAATGAALALGAFFLFRHRQRADVAFAGALLLGGGLGNLIDRLTRGGLVSDFLLLRLGPVHTGIFNVADMAITAGALLLALGSFLPSRRADL